MSKLQKNINLAAEQALNSTQTFRHGAVITGPGGKVICKGFNKGNRTKILNKIFTCTHAEIDVLNKLTNQLKHKHGKKYKLFYPKYSLWVTRIEKDQSVGLIKAYSKPCFYCTKILQEYGIKRVYYSLNNFVVKCEKTQNIDLSLSHKSDCQLKSEQVNTSHKLKAYF